MYNSNQQSKVLFNIIFSPLFIFTIVWIISLVSYLFAINISFIINPNYQILLFTFIVSYSIFFITYLSLAINKNYTTVNNIIKPILQINGYRLKLINRIILISIITIVLYNYHTFGGFPFYSFFGYDVMVYYEYGRFKGLLIPLLTIFGLLSIFKKNIVYRLVIIFFVVSLFVFYILRGPLLAFILQYFILDTLYKKKYSFLKRGAVVICLIFVTMNVLGNLRSGNELFLTFFNIKPEFQDINSGILWFLMYITGSFSDLITTLQYQNHYLYGISTLNDILPAFIRFDPIVANPNLIFIDGPKTYLAPFFEDFGWVGIIIINLIIAIMCFVIHNDSRFNNNLLIIPLLYSSISLIFFTNYFFYFSSIVQFFLSIFIFNFIKKAT